MYKAVVIEPTVMEIPQQCVDECATSGSNDEPVERWQHRLKFEIDPVRARAHLKKFGAWDDLETISETELNQRLLWTICWNFADGEEVYFIDT